MKVFDFDNTIYRGESSIDFSFYMIRHNRKILLYVPVILSSLVKYKLCLLSREKLESIINDFFEGVLEGTEDAERFISLFWETHAGKLNKRILQLIEPEDVILSASPSFLVGGIREKLGTDNILGTEVDLERKRITWFNFGENKVRRYRELYGDRVIDAFYTDSYNDRAMMAVSRKVFIVKRVPGRRVLLKALQKKGRPRPARGRGQIPS